MTPSRRNRLRQLLWLYFWLLIFEGALRRWIVPSLSNPLLLVRDPVALLALWWGWPLIRHRRWQLWLSSLIIIAFISFLLAITLGHGDIIVAAYGARIMLLQLPLIFLFAALFHRDDVIRFAWILLSLSLPMTFLLILQSNLPETHFLNVGPGGVGTSVFDGAQGRFRPPGVFTFINGVSLFFTLASASLFSVLYGSQIGLRGRLFCITAGIALVVALPVSISRSLLAGYLMVLTWTVLALVISRTRLVPLLTGLVSVCIVITLATAVPAFQDTSSAFIARWESAAANDGTDRDSAGDVGVARDQFQSRVLSSFTGPLSSIDDVPIFGYGIGIGTNVGSQRLTGRTSFIVGEGSWEATLNELGLPLGLTILLWRVSFCLLLLRLSLAQAVLGNSLPMILLGSSFYEMLVGQFSQPTALGFVVLSSGLTLAALNPSPGKH